jgi:iron complex outermembrane receptor protein
VKAAVRYIGILKFKKTAKHIRHITLLLPAIWQGGNLFAQLTDTASIHGLEEVIVYSGRSIGGAIDHTALPKPLSSVEEYLQTAKNVNMIKRGAYAWEPTVNNMTVERLSVTIDGMKVFSACPDRMDPITSYVETVNLSRAAINYGGEAQAGTNIGGSLDLKLGKAGFDAKPADGLSLYSGYESNGGYNVYGAGGSHSGKSCYVNSGIFRRQGGNYHTGNGREVAFSQFTKTNLFANLGFRHTAGHILESSIIYDVAEDVGYPALPMDVLSAKGLITSLSYRREAGVKWETKVYYNRLVHIMDDTKRPDVIMHMDMPGHSDTYGFYSLLEGRTGDLSYTVNADAYHNTLYSEMTMYPASAEEKPMFMLSLPDVETANAAVFVAGKMVTGENSLLQLSAKTAVQRDGVGSRYGLNTLRIYYPGMMQYRSRILWSVDGRYLFSPGGWTLSFGAGYSSRAPSASECYGYFLFNSADGYDHLGNPSLSNESALKTSLSLEWKHDRLHISAETFFFRFSQYILGEVTDIYPMTIGAEGVKKLRNVPHALLSNSNLSITYDFLPQLSWHTRTDYSIGRNSNGWNLPLIPPVQVKSSVTFSGDNGFSASLEAQGAARRNRYSAEYGEKPSDSYLIFNLSAGYIFRIGQTALNLKVGMENVVDKYYTTYSDWNGIPRRGRNIFINIKWSL